jgi:hypothetical protein
MQRAGRTRLALLAWCAGAALLAAPWIAAARTGSARAHPLGPLAPLFARWQWLRFDAQVWRGSPDRALALGHSAIALDPGSTSGWKRLAWHLALDRGSAERTARAADRVAWLRAGLDLAREGEQWAREPAELALFQALLLEQLEAEETSAELLANWPGGATGLEHERLDAWSRCQPSEHPPVR